MPIARPCFPAWCALALGAFINTAQAQTGLTDRFIVMYRGGASMEGVGTTSLERARIAGNRQGLRVTPLRRTLMGAQVYQLDRPVSDEQARLLAVQWTSGDADIEYAEPDRILSPQFTPDDPSYGQQWHYFDPIGGINAPAAWDVANGSGVVVAVLDTGVRPHADLAANLLTGHDFISNSVMANDGNGRDADARDPGDDVLADACFVGSPARDSTWHGTHVAGTIAALTHNRQGVAGVAWGARVLPVRVLGRCGGYTSDIADGIIWAAGATIFGAPPNPTPARVLNLSLGGDGPCDFTSQNAVNVARSRGAVVVVAAGNGSSNAALTSPASCNGVVTVAATGRTGARASYSNFGSIVSLAAPGGDGPQGVLSTSNTGLSAPAADAYLSYQGTSMAAPHVAGVAALMFSINPGLSPDQVGSILKATARSFPTTCSGCGTGIVDAALAVNVAAGTVPAPAPIGQLQEVEPNGTLATAQPLSSLPVQVNGTIGGIGDIDFYKVTVAPGPRITVTLTPNSASNYDLAWIDAAGRVLATSQRPAGQTDTVQLSNPGTSPVTSHLRVTHVNGLTGPFASYTLTLKK